MSQKIILIIGLGNIGKRYLEGILKVKYELKIYLIDININALNDLKKIIDKECDNNLFNKKIIFKLSIFEINEKVIDLAILTTTADVRTKLINTIVKSFKVNYWILEKLLAQSVEQINTIENLIKTKSSCWVNTPRRSMKWYSEIKKIITLQKTPLNFKITGGKWGLACNAIHFLDLVAWFTDSEIDSLVVKNNQKWIQSKRKNFEELYGEINVKFSDNSNLTIVCDQSNIPLTISVNNKSDRWEIIEKDGIAIGPNNKVIKGSLDYQSIITMPIVEGILNDNECLLTNLEQSAKLHTHLLNGLLKNFNQVNNTNKKLLPIT